MKSDDKVTMKHLNNDRLFNHIIAKHFGINAAVLINRIQHFIDLGYGVEYQGRRWIYNTYEQIISRELDWISLGQAKRLVWWLRDQGLLFVKRLQSHNFVQTNHYAINWEKIFELVFDSHDRSKDRHRSFQGSSAISDLYTEKTDQRKQEREKGQFINKFNESKQNENDESISNDQTPSQQGIKECIDESNAEKRQFIPHFHSYLIEKLSNCDKIDDPLAYAQTVVTNLKKGSESSKRLYQQWLDTGECDLPSTKSDPPSQPQKPPQKEQPHQPQSSPKQQHQPQETELKEWQIKPEDEELLDFGYQVGDIYPEFVQWCVPRLKYHPDLTDYATKSHVLYKLKIEPQLALELWRDFKRLLVKEYEDKQHAKAKGLPYWTPAWMKLPADVPVSEAKKASVALNEAKEQEQAAIEQSRETTSNHQLTASEDNQQEQNAIAASEDQQDQQELNPIESVKSAIALLEKHPNHPVTKGIVQNIIDSAKANATDEELEEIKRLENQAFEF